MSRSLLLVAVLLSVAMEVRAADSADTLARQFVDLLRYDEQFAKYQDRCVATHRSVSPEALVAQNADYFGGVRPGHKKWQTIVVGYETYFREACSRPNKGEFLSALSISYAMALSAQQLREAIAFYSSPTGKALVSAHKLAASAVYESWTAINSKYLAEITARFQKEIVETVQSK